MPQSSNKYGSSEDDEFTPCGSPFMCFPEATLTQSGLLELDTTDGEVELFRRSDIELRAEEPLMTQAFMMEANNNLQRRAWIERNGNLTVTVTTHRLVFFKMHKNANLVVARFLHHSNVHQAESTGGGGFMSFSSHKILLSTYLGDLLLVFRGSSNPSKDRDDCLTLLKKALTRRAWEQATRAAQQQSSTNRITARKVGVDAIMAKNAYRHKEAARLTKEAFQGDADTLLREATELVKVIHKYVATLDKNNENNDSSNQDAAKLAEMMQDMGMTSALSKKDYRSDDYYDVLARQLADFLRPKLPAAGGVMTLTDVYCLFNRARGTNLISPDDLLRAMECMKSLNLGMSQRTFPSGVKVVQEDAFDDTVMAGKLKELAGAGITALEASRALHISALLANEQLLAAEQMGYLCRDVTLETIRFFSNRFEDEFQYFC